MDRRVVRESGQHTTKHQHKLSTTTPQTSMSGIAVSPDAVNLYYLMKAKSAYRWALWRVDERGTAVVVAAAGDKTASYADLLSLLPPDDCRYAVYDYEHTNSEGRVFNKLVFLNWAPDAARVKAKMMYASTKDFFRGHLDGVAVELQASEIGELDEREVADAVQATITRK